MIQYKPLQNVTLADFDAVATEYHSDSKYVVQYRENQESISFNLHLVKLSRPYRKTWDFTQDTLQHYGQILDQGYSFGAYAGKLLVGFVLGEYHVWNDSLWVWEFHVKEVYRGRKIGKRLMTTVVEKAQAADIRTIVCETQNTNVPAIHVYRRLGFRIEGIDISYYTNDDYPDKEIAVFMKRRLYNPESDDLLNAS